MGVTAARIIRGRKFKRDDSPELGGTIVLRVHCSDRVNDTALVAGDSCPQIGAPYDATTPGLKAISVDVDEGEWTAAGGVTYIGTVEYSTKSTDPEKQKPDPTDREGVLRLNFESSEETIYKQLDTTPTAEFADGVARPLLDTSGTVSYWKWGSAITNSIGVPFPDGLKEAFADAVYTFEKNLTTDNWVTISDALDGFMNRVNSEDFSIHYRGATKKFTARTVWLTQASSEPGYENGVPYERVSVTLRVRKDGWLRKVLDMGVLHYLNDDPTPDNPKIQPIRDSNGDPITQPVPLDGRGSVVAKSGANPNGLPVFLKFRTKLETNFAVIPFPEFGAA